MTSGPSKLDGYFQSLRLLHQNLCPRQVLGVRMGLLAMELLGLNASTHSGRFAVIETDGCFAAAIAVATGCSLGKRNLRLLGYGKVGVTLVDVQLERAIRVRPHPLARERARGFAPDAATPWEAQLQGYQRMPIDELACAEPVRLALPISGLVSRVVARTRCEECAGH